ncbi:crotonobetainyl-CoA:carnitine CoA-transferase CaiB-like acyl-CoA transferase [Nonomuraea muscovyensis]|uniref:Crotonobetainyl-CoA:carnitine CoA-transferase CaiB-like acyl-CoA transferase n=1 Tax=Nonomuraea muscovyensis TaxID=1124761 RepID=A0A7X0C1W8_9ACTN|nr:CoA transferase [Nonomuraea muscovyensis]MBB6346918.1 crotonobetainyl-CoA:carnitine CoA-transferase CaiB-like acyl-CoA transferase [Nonomuraea muscovyensis]
MTSLAGLRVIDAATLFAGPSAAMMLGDFGADVVKIEHPRRGDPSRGHGASVDGVGLWWKTLSRNKRAAAVDLSRPEGQRVLRRLAERSDVLVENFRPGTLERWDLAPADLLELNPRLIVARMTGFGQVGPMAGRPGFGTLAEAMSGFAAMTGEPDGPPTLPPLALADGIAGLAMSYAVMVALHARERTGRGQVIDMAIIEPILGLLGPQMTAYRALGVVPPRTGNRSSSNAPRNTYRTRDGRWLAVSTSAQPIAERVVTLVGRPDLVAQPWFATGSGRVRHVDELDEAVAAWIAERDADEVIARFEEAQAAVAPIYDVTDIAEDPQYAALGTFLDVPDEELGTVTMQNVLFRLSDTPGEVRWAGRRLGRDTDEVLGELDYGPEEIAVLREAGVIA